MDRNDILQKAKQIKQGLTPSPMHQKIANVASDYMKSNMSTKGYLKNELKGIKRQLDKNIKDPEQSFKGLLGAALGQAITEYSPEGVYLNPTLKRLGYKTDSSNIYVEEPKANELFRIGGEISF